MAAKKPVVVKRRPPQKARPAGKVVVTKARTAAPPGGKRRVVVRGLAPAPQAPATGVPWVTQPAGIGHGPPPLFILVRRPLVSAAEKGLPKPELVL